LHKTHGRRDSVFCEDAFVPLTLTNIRCVVFDFGGTLSSDHYFKVAPPGYPDWQSVIQQRVFGNAPVVSAWMRGDLTLRDVAALVAQDIPLPLADILDTLHRGCASMSFNTAVWRFAIAQRREGRATALVTANMDVFTTTVVPAHGLANLFDVILNTADYREMDKSVLWAMAFERLGNGICYRNSLLVEDGPASVESFRSLGGMAFQYSDDGKFEAWLRSVGYSD
jgi:hypothetical protein